MIFTSFEFVIFFAVVVLVRGFIRNLTVEKWFLLMASYAFYMVWSIPASFLLLVLSLVNYFVGVGLGQIGDARNRKLLLVVSIVANLGVLGFFKYTNFVLDNVWWTFTALGFHVAQLRYDIVLPVGISFFTFISMGYTIEVYRRNIQPSHSLRDVLLFISLFPQILAGPINRAGELLPQLTQRVRATLVDVESGLAQFAFGAVKKLVISDRIAPHVDLIFGAPSNFDGFTLLQGLLGYAIQIYCDFSGYSDMAIGCARMMGFRFMENFQMPYSATTITEFWRRWHISLSSWFRDYVYIPMGGNRKGLARTYMNLLATMLLCGLWHGASWNFVFWGGLHGVSLAIHRVWKAWNPLVSLKSRPGFHLISMLLSRLLTLCVVVVGWLFFRAESWTVAGQYLTRLVTWSHGGTRMVSPYILAAVAVVFMTHVTVPKDWDWAREVPQWSVSLRITAYTSLALMIACLGATDSSPFIYFKF